MARLRTRYLPVTHTHAVIERDPRFEDAHIVSVGGAEQSHVDMGDPAHVFYEYLRRAANVVDLVRPGEPLRALHLGTGGFTLPRYIAHTRPGSTQIAVDIDPDLLDFVLTELPLGDATQAEDAGIAVLIDDARAVLPTLDGTFDVIMLDIFSGEDAPAHLTEPSYYAELERLLAPGGVLLVNIGDDPPLRFASTQMRAFCRAFPLSSTAALASPSMFTRAFPGNIVLAGLGNGEPWPEGWTSSLLARGPHPAGVLVGGDLRELLSRP